MRSSRWASLLGLAQRAGKVVSGEGLVVKEVQRGKARLVLLSEDASANTKKKVTDKCAFYGVPLCKVPDRYTLGGAIGKDARVVAAVTDEGFARQLQTMLD